MRVLSKKCASSLVAISLFMSGCAAVKVDHKETYSSYARKHKGEGSRVSMIGSEAELMADVVYHFESPGWTVTREPHALFAEEKYHLYAIYFYPSTLSNQTDVEIISVNNNLEIIKSEQADAFFDFFAWERIDKKVLKEGSSPILKEGLAKKLGMIAQIGNRKEALKYIDMGADIDLAISKLNEFASSMAKIILTPGAKQLYVDALTGIDLLKDLKKEPERREAEKRNEAVFQEALAAYRSAAVKPQLPEEARKFKVQAEFAFSKKNLEGAAARYKEALDVAPWWPEGHFNRALILGELFQYRDAINEMKRYLALVPDTPNARAAQDYIYRWEGELK